MPQYYSATGKGKQLADRFEADMNKFKGLITEQIEMAIRMATSQMYDDIVRISPRDTGLYVANHQLEINTRNTDCVYKERPKRGESFDAGPTIEKAKANLMQFKLGDKINIFSNLPYSMALEWGHSGKAPAGVYRVSMLNFKGYLREAVNRFGK